MYPRSKSSASSASRPMRVPGRSVRSVAGRSSGRERRLEQRLDAGDQHLRRAVPPRRQRRHPRGRLVGHQLRALVRERRPRLQHGDQRRVAEPRPQLLRHPVADLRVPGHPADPLAARVERERRGEERLRPVRDRRQARVPAVHRRRRDRTKPLAEGRERARGVEQPRQRREVRDASPRAPPGRAAIAGASRAARRRARLAPRPRGLAGRARVRSRRRVQQLHLRLGGGPVQVDRCSPASAAARRSAHSRATRSATLRWRVVRPRYRSLNAGSARPRRGPDRRPRRHRRSPSPPRIRRQPVFVRRTPDSSAGPPTSPGFGRPGIALARRRRRLQLEAVEPVRGLRRPLAGPRLHRVGGGVQQDRQARPLVRRELREDVVHRPAPRLADPHPEPRVLLRAQLVDDRAQPVVPAVRAGLAEPELAERQREVVRDDQHLAQRHPVPRQQLAHRDAGVVHVRLRLGEDQLQALRAQLDRRGRVALAAAAGPPVPVGEPVEHHPADVVARLRVLVARVAQADDELHDAGPDLLNARRTAPGRRPTGLAAMVPRSRRRAARSAPATSRGARMSRAAGPARLTRGRRDGHHGRRDRGAER